MTRADHLQKLIVRYTRRRRNPPPKPTPRASQRSRERGRGLTSNPAPDPRATVRRRRGEARRRNQARLCTSPCRTLPRPPLRDNSASRCNRAAAAANRPATAPNRAAFAAPNQPAAARGSKSTLIDGVTRGRRRSGSWRTRPPVSTGIFTARRRKSTARRLVFFVCQCRSASMV